MRRRTDNASQAGSLRVPRLALLFALLWTTIGCPGGSNATGGPVDECRETGQQCRLGGGQLGVCMRDVDGEFECVSQH